MSLTDTDREKYEHEIRTLQTSLSECQARLTQIEMKSMNDANEVHKSEVAQQKKLTQLEANLLEQQAAYAALQEEMKVSQTSLIEARRNEKEAKLDLTTLQTSFVTEMNRRETLETQLEESEKIAQDLRTQLKKLEHHHDKEMKTLRTTMLQEKDAAVTAAHAQSKLASSPVAASSASTAADASSTPSSSPNPANNVAALQKDLELLQHRLAASEEERARLESELATVEDALSRNKEEELIALEERFEESCRMKKMIKQKENEVEELQRTTRESTRETKEHKLATDRLQKDINAKMKLIESAEIAYEALQNKMQRMTDEARKYKSASESAAAKVKELEASQAQAKEEREKVEKLLQESKEELDRANKKRTELEQSWEKEREQLKQASTTTSSAAAASNTTSEQDQQQIRELRLKLRALEEIDEKYLILQQRQKELDILHQKKVTELIHEKIALDESLSILKEKYEREQEKRVEKDENEQESRLREQADLNDLKAQLTQLQTAYDAGQSKVEESEATMKQSKAKLSELEDRLATLTRQHELLQTESQDDKEKLTIMTGKLDHITKLYTALQSKYDSDRTLHLEEIQKLEQNIDDSMKRRMIFDELSMEAREILKNDKSSATIVENLQKKLQFYEDQLRDADESMNLARSSWAKSSTVLMSQLEASEKAVTQLKHDLHDALESKGLDATRLSTIEAKLKKSEKEKSKLSELMSRFEVELTHKKVELAASLDQLSTHEYENERLRAQLAKQQKISEAHLKALAQQ